MTRFPGRQLVDPDEESLEDPESPDRAGLGERLVHLDHAIRRRVGGSPSIVPWGGQLALVTIVLGRRLPFLPSSISVPAISLVAGPVLSLTRRPAGSRMTAVSDT